MSINLDALRTDFPEKLRARNKFNKVDWWFTALMVPLVTLTGVELGKTWAFLLIVVWFLGIMSMDYGKVHVVVTRRFKSLRSGKSSHTVLWASESRNVFRRRLPFDLAVGGIDDLGLLNRPDWVATVIEGEGSIIPSQELPSQHYSHRALADVIRKSAVIGSIDGHESGCGWVYRRRQKNMPQFIRNAADYVSPEVWQYASSSSYREIVDDKDALRSQAYAKNLRQLIGVTQSYNREVTMAAVFTTRGGDLEKRLSNAGTRRLPIVQLAKLMPAELKGVGVIDPRPLTPSEMHRFVRAAWDIGKLPAYYEQMVGLTDEDVLKHSNHQPQESIVAGDDYVYIDGTYHATIWIKGSTPKKYPNEFRELCNIPVPWLSVAWPGWLTSGKKERRISSRTIAAAEVFEDRVVESSDPDRFKKEEQRYKRQRQLSESTWGMDYNILVALHHITRKGLEDSVEIAERAISLMNLTYGRVEDRENRELQLPFLLSATTGIDVGLLKP